MSACSELRFVFQGELQQRVAASKIELGSDVGAVTVHGADADEQFVGDFFAALVRGHQLEHAPFRFGQGRQTSLLLGRGAVAATIQEIVGQYRCDIGVPRGDGFDACAPQELDADEFGST